MMTSSVRQFDYQSSQSCKPSTLPCGPAHEGYGQDKWDQVAQKSTEDTIFCFPSSTTKSDEIKKNEGVYK